MKLLHTSDWHLGKVLKGRSRLQEQVAVLAEIVSVAAAEQPDLVIVAGDLFDNLAPAAETMKVAVRALSALRRNCGAVVVIAGNHDHGGGLDALRPWADGAGITLRGTIGRPEDHLISGVSAAGQQWRVAALPFVSQRHAVRASEMFELSAAEASATYADHVARLIAALTGSFADSTATVNLITTHLTVVGGKLGGGERDAHTIEAYAVPSSIFPTSAHYVALGHLHRRQRVVGAAPVHYCGSPIAIDFGEEQNTPSVNLVELTHDTAAKVRAVPLSSAVALLTVAGSLAELESLQVDPAAWLRVYVRERPRAGLKEQVQALLPNAVEVRLDPAASPPAAGQPRYSATASQPRELFAEYLTAAGIEDPAVGAMFNRLYEEVSCV